MSGGRNFVIFGGRIESGADSSGFFVDEVRVGKTLRIFCWAKREWGRTFGIIRARSERGTETYRFLVNEVRMS